MDHDITELDELIAEITVDCYDEDEQLSAFLVAFAHEIETPLEADLLDITVQVHSFDLHGSPGALIARCRHGASTGEISLADLTFPPGTVAAWIHAAYRRFLLLEPRPATKPARWTLSW